MHPSGERDDRQMQKEDSNPDIENYTGLVEQLLDLIPINQSVVLCVLIDEEINEQDTHSSYRHVIERPDILVLFKHGVK